MGEEKSADIRASLQPKSVSPTPAPEDADDDTPIAPKRPLAARRKPVASKVADEGAEPKPRRGRPPKAVPPENGSGKAPAKRRIIPKKSPS